jgi:hypothetical protein
MWKCLLSRLLLMHLCMMTTSSSAGVNSRLFSTHPLFSIITPYRAGTHLYCLEMCSNLKHELPSFSQTCRRGHLTTLVSMHYVSSNTLSQWTGGLDRPSHSISMLYTTSLLVYLGMCWRLVCPRLGHPLEKC